SPRWDWRAALLTVAVDLNRLPDLVDVVGIAASERLRGGAVPGVDDEDAADRCLAVVCKQGAGRHDIDIIFFCMVKMDTVRAVEFGSRRHPVAFVGGVDHEQH